MPFAIECDVRGIRGYGFNPSLSPVRRRPPTTELFHNNSYAHDDKGDNPRQEIEGSTMSSIN